MEKESFTPCLPASASAQERSPFFYCFKKVDRFLRSQQFWPAAQRSWPLLAFCFSTNRLRGNGFSVSHSRSSACSSFDTSAARTRVRFLRFLPPVLRPIFVRARTRHIAPTARLM